MKKSVQIRAATLDDIEAMVDLHYRTFDVRANQLLLFGRSFMKAAFRWYCQGPGAFALVAEDETGLKGYITVNKGPYHNLFRHNWCHMFWALLSHPNLWFSPSVAKRVKSLLNLVFSKRPKNNSEHRATLAYLAVNQDKKTPKGVSNALVTGALRQCHAYGWHEVVTAFHEENTLARCLFMMLGFVYQPELDLDGLVCVQFDTNKLKPPSVS